jgi:glycerophosphoryl diester phosphodiesterase
MHIIAHRGASGTEPENTIRSFKKAEEMGPDMIELDVRKSKDGQLVISHDSDLLRLFGDPRLIKDLPVSEIKRVSKLTDREIPTMDEVLMAVVKPLNIHVKVHGIEAELLLKIKNFPHRILISSTFPGVLKKIRILDGKIELGLIIGKGELHLLPFINWYTKKITALLDSSEVLDNQQGKCAAHAAFQTQDKRLDRGYEKAVHAHGQT